MKPVRIGLVGVGFMGQAAHLRNYATLEDCEVAAVRPSVEHSRKGITE